MRSLKADRKPKARRRPKPVRRSVRPTREQPVFGKRKRSPQGGFGRFLRNMLNAASTRHPMKWVAASIALIVLAGALLAGGYVTAARNAGGRAIGAVAADAGFAISSVRLTGNHRTQPSDILAALGFEPGESIFAADMQNARARLLKLTWVADAEVRRQYPDSISLTIVEKLPFALWETANGIYVVERSGRTIALANPTDFPHLPYLIGDGAPEPAADFIEAVDTHRAVRARVKALQRVSGRRWNLILDDDVIVELPEDGWARQLDVLEHLIVDKGVLERDISEIDLRARDNYFFVLRNGQKQQATRGNAA